MNRTTVKSSMIASIGFESNTSTLEIEFNNGAVWQYYKVPENVYFQMKSADSCGKFFLHSVKDEYDESRVR